MKTFEVCTFYNPEDGKRLCLSRISAYTIWFSYDWEGSRKHIVEAKNGKEAKKIATAERLQIERERLKDNG